MKKNYSNFTFVKYINISESLYLLQECSRNLTRFEGTIYRIVWSVPVIAKSKL